MKQKSSETKIKTFNSELKDRVKGSYQKINRVKGRSYINLLMNFFK